MWSVVIGGVICLTLLLLLLTMLHRIFSTRPRGGAKHAGSTCTGSVSTSRPSTCDDALDLSYQSKSLVAPEDVKFLVCPGSDEDDWTDSFCRRHYGPEVHRSLLVKKPVIYNTF